MLSNFEGIKHNEPMNLHTTFRTGGVADLFYEPHDNDSLKAVLAEAKNENVPVTVIGNGSNLLVLDGGIRGLVIKLGKKFSASETDGEFVVAQSGALMSQVAMLAYNAGLGGFEFAQGIPGSVGGGLYMNAGAYGGEMKDVIQSAEYLKDGMIYTINAGDMKLSYRKSIFMENGGVITSVRLKLYRDNKEEILAKINDFKCRRVSKQPLEFASAGSTFKRPEGYFAGALIEQAGLKGKNVGAAEVSQKHAGFIINRGGATAKEILELIEIVKETVYKDAGVMLETEVKIIGEE
ncbi:MAG: UDP-N-acetylmuramate dehydrogenase [Eubacteriales bacterium]|nr:UDP-N-acetylmuramate dehydrogenase [Eubacteriales bacterium]